MSIAIDRVIRIARSQVGTTESPRGSNRTKYGRWYGMNGVRWCAIGLSWMFNEAGYLKLVGGKHASTRVWARWFQKNKAYHSKPKPGDVGFINFGFGIIRHVGYVEAVSKDGKTLWTYEGNTSSGKLGSQSNGGGWFHKKRSIRDFTGFGRPDYPHIEKPLPKPLPKPEPKPVTQLPKWPLSKPGHYFGIDLANNLPKAHTGRGNASDKHSVMLIQMEINERIRLRRAIKTELRVNGYYDELTRDAVIREQRRMNAYRSSVPVEVDGKVGPLTWSRLFEPKRQNRVPRG